MSRPNSRQTELIERARKVIPGGMYGHQSVALLPDGYPQFFSRAQGCRLWDADGNEYLDYICGYGPNLLGYGHAAIDAAAAAQQRRGDTMTGPSDVMVELAEKFVSLIAHADWAMFCKNGTDATSIAMMGARSHTGRRKILVADGAYHGSAAWCLQRGAGRVAEDQAHVIRFEYKTRKV
jgi:glutamate-1-semialdehyde 2,1-aminomutase